MSREFLEKQYNPCAWSNRSSNGKEVIEIHDKFGLNETTKCRQKYETHLDVPYGDSSRERMDIYFKKSKEIGTPIFVHIHGGTWQSVNREDCGFCIPVLAENNIKVIVLEYNLCPKVTLEGLKNQFRKGLKKVLEYAKETETKEITICGHSAGAHLVALMLSDKDFLSHPDANLLKSVFLLGGVYDLTDLTRKLESANPNNILSLNDSNVKELSPQSIQNYSALKTSSISNIYVYAAEHDSPTFIQQSVNFHKKLQELVPNKNVEYTQVKGVDHFNLAEKLTETDYVITKKVLSFFS